MTPVHRLWRYPVKSMRGEDIAEFQLVRRGDPVRIERVQPRRGALAATIEVMAAET
jgi:uncharacterized protein YcbX